MDNLKNKARLSTGQIVAVVLVFVISAALFITGSYFVLYEPEATPTVPFIETETDTSAPTGEDTTDPLPTFEPVTEKSYNFLVVGHDRVAVLADVIMLINFNVTDNSLTIMQIPRDTYVDISRVTGDKNDKSLPKYTQINVAFASYYGRALNNGSKNPTAEALSSLTSLIEKTLCVNVSYSAVMNLEGFVNIVDIIGGVEMDVPCDMDYDDPYQDLSIHIKAGKQTLSGADAEGFVRFRHDYIQADIGRGNAQKLFMAAFLKKLLASVDLTNVTKIASQVLKNVTTDLGIDDIVYFAKNALKLDMAKITLMTIPSSGTSTGGIVINRKYTLERINKYFNLYTNDITSGIFDKSRALCPTDEYSMGKYYDSYPEIATVYTAAEIIEKSIDIPRM